MKIRVVGDKNNIPFCSSDIIISNLNAALTRIGVYGDDKTVVYDCLGNSHGYKADAKIVCYEFIFPDIILNNIRDTLTLGVGRDNMSFMIEGGHPRHLSDYFCLGVDTSVWEFKGKKDKDIIRILGIGESNTRGGLETVVNYIAKIFSGKKGKGVELYLRDRSASPKFKTFVKEVSNRYDFKIIHDDRDLKNFSEELKIYHDSDLAVCLNRSSTWNLRAIECMATGTPLMAMAYAGHREYLSHYHTGIEVFYDLYEVDDITIDYLVNLGLRNHLFNRAVYGDKVPIWAIPQFEDFELKIMELVNDKGFRDKLSAGGRNIAEKFSWQRSANELYNIIKNN